MKVFRDKSSQSISTLHTAKLKIQGDLTVIELYLPLYRPHIYSAIKRIHFKLSFRTFHVTLFPKRLHCDKTAKKINETYIAILYQIIKIAMGVVASNAQYTIHKYLYLFLSLFLPFAWFHAFRNFYYSRCLSART